MSHHLRFDLHSFLSSFSWPHSSTWTAITRTCTIGLVLRIVRCLCSHIHGFARVVLTCFGHGLIRVRQLPPDTLTFFNSKPCLRITMQHYEQQRTTLCSGMTPSLFLVADHYCVRKDERCYSAVKFENPNHPPSRKRHSFIPRLSRLWTIIFKTDTETG